MLQLSSQFTYTGEKQPPQDQFEEHGLRPYIPSQDLVDAVNLTIFLKKRPLLLMGEPGCGKTRLAEMVAYELDLSYFPWHIKSTSKAKDGLYTYDALQRLHDVQLASKTKKSQEKVDDIKNYIKLGELGKAFRSEDKPGVVLIDEIDKADIDFPNDLLQALDEQRFEIDEPVADEDKEVRAKHPPIVFITSNGEKNLPPAFLRRCLFHYVKFPDQKLLSDIVKANFPKATENLIQKAVDRFTNVRGYLQKNVNEVEKNASTSELLDWFQVLYNCSNGEDLLDSEKLPFPEVILKTISDFRYLD